jgi:hypothetical protein
LGIILDNDADEVHDGWKIVLFSSVDAVVRVNFSGKLVDVDVSAVGYQSHITVVRQSRDNCPHFFTDCCKFFLFDVDIHYEEVGSAIVNGFRAGSELEGGVGSHELMRKFPRSYTLRVVSRKLGGESADAASDGLLIEVDGGVAVEDGLTGAGEWSVFEKGIVGLLLGGVVESGGDGAFALHNFSVGGDVIDESDRIYLLIFLIAHI